MRQLILPVALLGVLASVPSVALAQQDPRALFEEGRRAIEQQRYADAIAPLERSYQLRASPVVIYNLAIAYRATGRLRDSIAAFENYLTRPSRTATPTELQVIQAEMASLRAQLCTLRVQLSPSQATLVLNRVPLVPTNGVISLDPGANTVAVMAPGFQTRTESVSCVSGQRIEFARALIAEVTTGHVVITTDDSASHIFVDGMMVGTGTVTQELAPGDHAVMVQSSRGRREQRSLRVSRGGHNRLEISVLRSGGLPGWVVPVSVIGGVLVAGGVAAAAIYATTPPLYEGSFHPTGWGGNVNEMSGP